MRIASLGFCIVDVVLFFTIGQLDNLSGNILPSNSSLLDISRSVGLVFPSLSEFSTVYCDPHSQRLWYSQ